MTIKQTDDDFIIFSIDNSENPLKRTQFELMMNEMDIGFKRVSFAAESMPSLGYIINAKFMGWLEASPYIKGQKAMLFLFKDKNARKERKTSLGLLKNGLTVAFKDLGYLGSTTELDAISNDVWAYDEKEDNYYTIKKEK